MRDMIPPGVMALEANEHDEACQAIAAAEQLGTEMERLDLGINSKSMDLGKLFKNIRENNRWIPTVRGMKFEEWTRKNFRTRDGRPMKADSAKRLANHCEEIRKYPRVEKVVRHGEPQRGMFTCITGAYYACRIADMSEWRKEAISEFLKTAPISEDLSEKAAAYATEKVQDRIISLLIEKSSSDLRVDYTCLTHEIESGGTPDSFVRLNSPVVEKHVFDKVEQMVLWLAELSGEEVHPRTMKPTTLFERLACFVEDTQFAFESEADGNSGPLESIRTTVLERRKQHA